MTGSTDLLSSWHHIAAVWDGNNISLYIDGVKEGSDQPQTAPPSGSGNTLLIGSYSPTHNFQGNLDEIKVYNYARSQDEIALDAGIPGSVVLNEIMWAGSSSFGIADDHRALWAEGIELDGGVLSQFPEILGGCCEEELIASTVWPS